MDLLVVDDDPPILKLFGSVGESCGYKVETMSDAGEFIARCDEKSPDVLVLDLVMPNVDGIEVLRTMSEMEVGSHVLLITGFDPELLERAQALAKAWNLNIIGGMTKPVDPHAVQELLAKLIEDN